MNTLLTRAEERREITSPAAKGACCRNTHSVGGYSGKAWNGRAMRDVHDTLEPGDSGPIRCAGHRGRKFMKDESRYLALREARENFIYWDRSIVEDRGFHSIWSAARVRAYACWLDAVRKFREGQQ